MRVSYGGKGGSAWPTRCFPGSLLGRERGFGIRIRDVLSTVAAVSLLLLAPGGVEASPKRKRPPPRVARLLNISKGEVKAPNFGIRKRFNRVTITREMYDHLFAFFPDPGNPKVAEKPAISDEDINNTLARLSPLSLTKVWVGRLIGAMSYSRERSTQYSLLLELVPDPEPRILHLVVSAAQLRDMQF